MLHMPMSSRKDYLKEIYKRYRESPKKEKQKILDEFSNNTGYNRKYAIRLLNGVLRLESKKIKRPGRKPIYTNEDIYYLKKVWDILDYPCGERLAPEISEIINAMERCGEWRVPLEVKKRLSEISGKTCDRKLSLWKNQIRKSIYGTTKPGSLLKKQIPIVLSRWDEKRPGYTELDLVAHCGNSAYGDFISTLNLTDLATQWTEQAAIMGKAQKRVKFALDNIEERLPFKLLGIDPDNGSEFINWQLYLHCLEKEIEFTRGRPMKKNDNAHIEEKNWTHVRKIVGYSRLETEEELFLLNQLYRGPLRLYMNYFQPTMKLIKKARVGGILKRQYDQAKTPYQRVLESKYIPESKKQVLRKIYKILNPLKLKQEIETITKQLRSLSAQQKQTPKIIIKKSLKEAMPTVTFSYVPTNQSKVTF